MYSMAAADARLRPLLALSRLRRRRFDDAIELSTAMLKESPLDQQAWFIKVRATSLKAWVDDTQLEEQGAPARQQMERPDGRHTRRQDGCPLSDGRVAEQVPGTCCWKTARCRRRRGRGRPWRGP